ncbi:MAG: hypothetical protein CSA11_10845, partial [Chloroflexi bacterium]
FSPSEIAAFFQAEDRVLHSWWRETILLTIGYLGKTAIGQSLKLVKAILSAFPHDVAGLAAAELAAAGLLELEAPTPDTRQEVHDRLVALLTNPLISPPCSLRALAGRTLSRLGDKRPGVGTVAKNSILIPDVQWGGEVPPGTYQIGGTGRWDEEVRDAMIQRPYRLARYPITNAQFQCFVEASDRDEPAWWHGLPAAEKKFSAPEFPDANHPRDSVSWCQAVAFCRWLSHKLGDEVGLPHEDEWEVAARWDGEKADSRMYPWAGDFEANKANTQEGGVRQTTAVGIYPAGKNVALELYDLSGNVWEWCVNKYRDPAETAVDEARRVVRGGSWNYYQDAARVACRGYDPPTVRSSFNGFRVVCRPPSHFDH